MARHAFGAYAARAKMLRERTDRQKARMAELVSGGLGIIAAGRELGVGEQRALKIWKKIKDDLGWQAYG